LLSTVSNLLEDLGATTAEPQRIKIVRKGLLLRARRMQSSAEKREGSYVLTVGSLGRTVAIAGGLRKGIPFGVDVAKVESLEIWRWRTD